MTMHKDILLATRYLNDDLMNELRESSNFDIDTPEHGLTPLIVIIQEGRDEGLKFLIDNGASVNWMRDDTTPLIQAIIGNHIEMVKELINAGADVNLNSEFSSPLLDACEKSNLALFKILVEAGADVDGGVVDDSETPLSRAINYGTAEIVQCLIESGANLNCDGEANAVISAVYACRDDILDLVLKAGGNANALDNYGYPLLDRLIYDSRINTASILLEHGASTDIATGDDGLLPLHQASMWGNIKLVELLLNYKAGLHAVDFHGWSALMYADFHYAPNVVELLKQAGTSFPDNAHWDAIARINHGLLSDAREAVAPLRDASDYFKSKAMEAAVRSSNDPGIVEALLEIGCEPDNLTQKNEYLLDLAVLAHRFETVDLLMKAKGSLSRPGVFFSIRSPLFSAVKSGRTDMVKSILAFAEIPGDQDILNEAADSATRANNLEMLSILSEAGASPEGTDPSFGVGLFSSNLISVVTDGHHDMLRHLVAQGADLEEQGFMNLKPLHIAAEAGDITAVQILVAGNADINASSSVNNSPLSLAVANGHPEVVQYLIDNGAVTNAKVSHGTLFKSSLVADAIDAGNLETLKILLAHDVELDVTSFSSNSSLHAAILAGQVDMIEPLIEAGASIDAINLDSQTPLQLAEANDNEDVVRTLKGAIKKNIKTSQLCELISLSQTESILSTI